MRLLLVAVFALAIIVPAARGQEKPKPKEDAKKDAPQRVDLIRFYDKKLHEHVYSYGDGEPAQWRQKEEMEGETVIGQVAIAKEQDTTRLFRAVRKDGKHYFYLQKPLRAADFIVILLRCGSG